MAFEDGGGQQDQGTQDTGGLGGSAESTPAPAAPAAPDYSQVLDKLDRFGSSLNDLSGRFEQRFAPEPEPEPDDGFDLEALLNELPPDSVADDGLTMEGLAALTQRQAQQAIEQYKAEQAQVQLSERRAREMDALEQRFPRLADENVARQVVDRAIAAAVEICEGTGMDPVGLAQEPRFVARIYRDFEAEQAQAEGRAPGTDQQIHVQRPGGGGPVEPQRTTSDEEADRIVAVSRKGPNIFG